MRRCAGARGRLAGLAAMLAIAGAAQADAPDPAPTIATDPATNATVVTGAHHPRKVALNLNVTDWWLGSAIGGGQASDVRLMFDASMPSYATLDRATDDRGTELQVIPLRRGPSAAFPHKVEELVAVVLPPATIAAARRSGLTLTIAGAQRSFPVVVPAQSVEAFLTAYDLAGAGTGHAPSPIPPLPPQPAAAIAPSAPIEPVSAPPANLPIAPAASAATPHAAPDLPPAPHAPIVSPPGPTAFTPEPDTAPSTTGEGGEGTPVPSLGLEFVPTPQGAMVLASKPGSIADRKGIESGDFIESVDGKSLGGLSAPDMAARIGAPGARTLHMIAAGDIRVR